LLDNLKFITFLGQFTVVVLNVKPKIMKRIVTILSLAGLLAFISCEDHNEHHVTPTGDFDYELAFKGTQRTVFPTYEFIDIIDKSLDAKEYLWDFGNGETSTEIAPRFSYSKSGAYVITLTVTSSTGDKSTVTKNIAIVDRKLKDIRIERLDWNCIGELPDWQDDKVSDVFVEIRDEGSLYYKSPIVKNVPEGTTPIMILVNENVIIDSQDLMFNLAFRLIAVDDDGNEKVVYTSAASGCGFSSDGIGNSWRVLTGFGGTTLTFNCQYE